MGLPLNSEIDLHFLIVDFNGVGATGQAPVVSIRRDSDGKWYDGAGFGSTFQSLNMTELDASNQPGVYKFAFDQSDDGTEQRYLVHYINPTGVVTADVEELSFLDEGTQKVVLPFLTRETLVGSSKSGRTAWDGPVGIFDPI